MFMKAAVATVLRRFGYRPVLIYNSLISAVFLAACATLHARHAVRGHDRHPAGRRIFPLAAIHRRQHHRLRRSRAAADEPGDRAHVASAQQLALSTGVAVGALVVEITLRLKHGATMSAADFPPAFLVVAASTAAAALIFLRLPRDAGAELAGSGRGTEGGKT